MQKNPKKEILFICIENSTRGQMAEGFARAEGLNAFSAGTIPATRVNQLVVQAMDEEGIDISKAKPRLLTFELIDRADLVILTDSTLESAIPKRILRRIGKKLVVWSIPDPQGQPIEVIRLIRDRVRKNVDSLLEPKQQSSNESLIDLR